MGTSDLVLCIHDVLWLSVCNCYTVSRFVPNLIRRYFMNDPPTSTEQSIVVSSWPSRWYIDTITKNLLRAETRITMKYVWYRLLCRDQLLSVYSNSKETMCEKPAIYCIFLGVAIFPLVDLPLILVSATLWSCRRVIEKELVESIVETSIEVQLLSLSKLLFQAPLQITSRSIGN